MQKRSIVAVAVALGLGVMGSGLVASDALAGSGKYEGKKNIVQVAREAGSFTTLIKALEATDLVGTLSGQGKGPFTVFAPTDAAFAKLPAGTLAALLNDPAALKKILLYHVVPGQKLAADVVNAATLPTVNGQDLRVSTQGGVKVNDSNVTATDVRARNGVIHVIDTVLIPS
jgi:uncharacterized surface protein with fasciclin (FAS1) repeats